MNKSIDLLASATGWANSGLGSITASENQVPDFVAGLDNAASLILSVPSGNNGKSIKKTITFDLTGYSEVTLHVWSREKHFAGSNYQKSSDFAYKISFDGVNEYYLPTFSGFNDVSLYVYGLTTIDRIEVTCLHDDDDYLIISNLVAVKDEIPVDIFRGVKAQIEHELKSKYLSTTGGVANKGVLLGTVTGAAGDRTIYNINSYGYLDRYAVIMIDDGANTETHQLNDNDSQEFSFTSLYDGEVLLHDHTNADLYLICPVEYGTTEREIILPGISVWGIAPEEILRTNKIEEFRDTFNVNETVQSRLTPITFQYIIMMDCEARQNELIALMSLVCRTVIGKQYIWVNGKKINLFSEGAGEFIEPVEGYNEIPKMQFRTRVEIKEDIFDRSSLVKTITNTLTVNIQ